MTNATDGDITGFVIDKDGTVFLGVRTWFGQTEVKLSASLVAGLAEASKVAAGTAAAPEPVARNSEPSWYYFQVAPPKGGKHLTYKSSRPVRLGQRVILPPLPWMIGLDWTSTVTGLGRPLDYRGEIKPIYATIN
jgi:hypothetical protein